MTLWSPNKCWLTQASQSYKQAIDTGFLNHDGMEKIWIFFFILLLAKTGNLNFHEMGCPSHICNPPHLGICILPCTHKNMYNSTHITDISIYIHLMRIMYACIAWIDTSIMTSLTFVYHVCVYLHLSLELNL